MTPDWLTPHLPGEVISTELSGAELIAEITADAFRDDPINNWIFGSFDGMQAMFRAMAKSLYCKSGMCHSIGHEAATMWALPNMSASLPVLAMAPLSVQILRHSGIKGLKRAMAVDEAMQKQHPKKSHLYLFTVGVRSSSQGQGLGKRILSPVLKACDHAKIPAYLENSNPENHGFYASLGFEQIGLFHPAPGCPIMEPMWREPRPVNHQGEA